jgi:hypothetical protein
MDVNHSQMRQLDGTAINLEQMLWPLHVKIQSVSIKISYEQCCKVQVALEDIKLTFFCAIDSGSSLSYIGLKYNNVVEYTNRQAKRNM